MNSPESIRRVQAAIATSPVSLKHVSRSTAAARTMQATSSAAKQMAADLNSRSLMASPAPRTTSGYERISHFQIENCAVRYAKADRPMSALGQKQTSQHVPAMSALPPKADIGTQPLNVRFVPE